MAYISARQNKIRSSMGLEHFYK